MPLVIRPPGGLWRAGHRVEHAASHIDLFPTILELFGISAPDHLGGRSVIPLITDEEAAHRPSYMEHNLYGPYHYAWYDGRYKLIMNERGTRGFLYDLETDPKEQTKLGQDHPKYQELRKQAHDYRQALKKASADKPMCPQPAQMPKDVEKALRSLGYVE